MIFSYSRAAYVNYLLAVLLTILVTGLRRRGGARAVKALLALIVIAIATAGVLAFTGSLDFFDQRAQAQAYDTDRFGAQRVGYELGWEYPLGVGPGQFQFHHPVESHSTYVRVMAEQGVVGLVAWLALVISTLVIATRNAIAGRGTFGIGSAALLGSWCGLLFNSAVVDTLHWRHMWVVAGLIWAGATAGAVMRASRTNV